MLNCKSAITSVGVNVSNLSGSSQFNSDKLGFDAVVLAVGHSARDVYHTLLSHKWSWFLKILLVVIALEVVQVDNVEENGTMEPNAEDGIYNELVNLINLDEFNGGASAIGSMPAVYMFDEPLDDPGFNLGTFYVD
ncbi:hypothetical protein Tco_0191474 [Tanacetum coccineum]